MRLIGSYFELTDRVSNRPSGKAPGATAAEGRGDADRRSELLISVAKRLVRSAVRRNTVKRIVREAWRAALRENADPRRATRHPTPPSTDKGIADQGSEAGEGQDGGGGVAGETGGRLDAGRTFAGRTSTGTCLVRLKRYPGAAVNPKPNLAMIKHSLRKDADQLFATWLSGSGRAVPRRPASGPGGPSPGVAGPASAIARK